MASVKFVRDRARRILKAFGAVTPPPPIPVRAVIEWSGLTIEDVAREDTYDGELVPALRRIKVNAGKPLTRQRFTLAHELGHWVLFHQERLHEDESLPLEADPEDFDEADFSDNAARQAREAEANDFAAELLMPTQWVKASWKKARNVEQLAEAYGVSPEAMWRQVMDLGLIK